MHGLLASTKGKNNEIIGEFFSSNKTLKPNCEKIKRPTKRFLFSRVFAKGKQDQIRRNQTVLTVQDNNRQSNHQSLVYTLLCMRQ